jgi:hypothetical protein
MIVATVAVDVVEFERDRFTAPLMEQAPLALRLFELSPSPQGVASPQRTEEAGR